MKLEDSAQRIADVVMDAVAKADEAVLDLEVLVVTFTIVLRDDDGRVRPVISTWADGYD